MTEALEARIPSRWVRELVRKRGGVLNVAWRLVCMG